MPTYEYECESCGHRFERFQAMSDSRVSDCPKCSAPVRRLISGGIGIISRGPKCELAGRCGSEGGEFQCDGRAGSCDPSACGGLD